MTAFEFVFALSSIIAFLALTHVVSGVLQARVSRPAALHALAAFAVLATIAWPRDANACSPYEPVVLFPKGAVALAPAGPARATQQAELRAFAAWTRAAPGYPVRLVGHADTRGTTAQEDRASRRRAEAVRDALVKLGVPRRSITVEARGSRDLPFAIADEVREPRANRVQLFSMRPNCAAMRDGH